MKRIDYVKAAILNDRGMYDEAMTDAYFWRGAGLNYQMKAAEDFETLHGSEVASMFPWLLPTSEELRGGYLLAVNELADESFPELMGCRSGSAIYWDPAEGVYLIAEGANYGPDHVQVTNCAETLEAAIRICDDRAGICTPVNDAPKTLREW